MKSRRIFRPDFRQIDFIWNFDCVLIYIYIYKAIARNSPREYFVNNYRGKKRLNRWDRGSKGVGDVHRVHEGVGDLQMSREVNPALSTVNSPLTA